MKWLAWRLLVAQWQQFLQAVSRRRRRDWPSARLAVLSDHQGAQSRLTFTVRSACCCSAASPQHLTCCQHAPHRSQLQSYSRLGGVRTRSRVGRSSARPRTRGGCHCGGADMYQPSAAYSAPGTYYSIDVECVATGTDHNSRAVGQLALVDQYEQVVLDVVVKPEAPVVSYLTALTGLTAARVDAAGVPLATALAQLRSVLPASAVLVGQNILQDVTWLGLKEGADYASVMDLAGLFRVWNTRYNTWSVFSQDHLARVLLGWDTDGTGHDAALDALKSMRLFNLYNTLSADGPRWAAAQQALLDAPPTPSFSKQHPTYEGVCMGNRRSCSCGAAFFS